MKLFKGKIECQKDYKLEVYNNSFSLYDNNNNHIYYEDNDDYWSKSEYDDKGNRTHYKNSKGYWNKSEYDDNNNLIYYEDSEGIIKDDRPKKYIIIINGKEIEISEESFKALKESL